MTLRELIEALSSFPLEEGDESVLDKEVLFYDGPLADGGTLLSIYTHSNGEVICIDIG